VRSINRRTLTLVVAVLLVVSACGGSSSPENYFSDLSDGTAAYADALSEMRAGYGEALRSELEGLQEDTDFTDTAAVDAYFDQAKEVAIVKTADLFTDTGAQLRSLIDALRQMEPPEALRLAHQDAVATGEALAAALPVTIQAVRSLDAIEDLQETIDRSQFAVAAQRFSIACQNLEDAATGAGIEVDVRCPDGIGAIPE
jgi:hypothetical protein